MQHFVIGLMAARVRNKEIVGGLFLVDPEPSASQQFSDAGGKPAKGFPKSYYFPAEKSQFVKIRVVSDHAITRKSGKRVPG